MVLSSLERVCAVEIDGDGETVLYRRMTLFVSPSKTAKEASASSWISCRQLYRRPIFDHIIAMANPLALNRQCDVKFRARSNGVLCLFMGSPFSSSTTGTGWGK